MSKVGLDELQRALDLMGMRNPKNLVAFIEEVALEKQRVEAKLEEMGWNDEDNTANDWVTYICMYATKGVVFGTPEEPLDEKHFLDHMVKVAGLAASAYEMASQGLMEKRHYD